MKVIRIVHTVTGHVYSDVFNCNQNGTDAHASVILQSCFTENNNNTIRLGSLIIPQKMIECIEIKESK